MRKRRRFQIVGWKLYVLWLSAKIKEIFLFTFAQCKYTLTGPFSCAGTGAHCGNKDTFLPESICAVTARGKAYRPRCYRP